MGCDIHIYLEKKINGNWVSADPFTIDLDGNLDVDRKKRIYRKRDYLVFSVLAGVRTFPMPSEYWQKYEATGFPADADPLVKQVYDRYGIDAHTASSLTLKQVTAVDWEKEAVPLQFDGTARQKEIYDFCKNKFINENGKFEQGAWKLTKPFVIDYFLYDAIKAPWISVLEVYLEPKHTPTTTFWALVPLELACEEFYEVIRKLEDMTITENLKDDEIRLVFWFDN